MWFHFLLIGSGLFASLCWTRSGSVVESSDKGEASTIDAQIPVGLTPNTPKEFKMSGLTKECCTKPAIHSEYLAVGSNIKISTDRGELDVYQTGDIASKRVLIAVYDIFGYHPNTKQLCDQLAKAGFLIVMPDFFRGSPWDRTNFPPKERQQLLNWVSTAGSFPEVVQPDIRDVLDYYKAKGANSFGIFGFCWGGKMSILAGSSDLSTEIKGAGLIHAAFIEESDAENVKIPVLLLPSKNEGDNLPILKRIRERLGDDSAEHHRFEDMEHGFAAARGDFKDELTRTRVEEVIGYLSGFFNKHIPISA